MTAPTLRHTTNSLLARLLEEPHLDQQLRQLEAREFRALLSEVGLEDAGELLPFATRAQLLELLDEELWVPQGEGADTMDAERFATLLEVLRESGSAALADKLTAFSEDFLCLALGQLISVWPTEWIQRYAAADEHGQVEKKLEAQLLEEFEEYLVLSKTATGWDSVIDLLSTWNEGNADLLDRILSRLADASTCEVTAPEELVQALEGMDAIREDAEAEREERRAAHGYVSVRDARAFLRLPPMQTPHEKDGVSLAYFRRLQPSARPMSSGRSASALGKLLQRYQRPTKPLLEPERPLQKALKRIHLENPALHERFVEELAFLVNVVVAADASREVNPAEALRTVSARVEAAGHRVSPVQPNDSDGLLAAALVRWGPIGLFRG